MENKRHGDLFTNGEKPNGKNPTGWFLGHHSRSSTIITTSDYKQGIPSTLPTYSWVLTPIPNRTCSVVTVPLSNARLPSTRLTNCTDPSTRLQKHQSEKIVGCKVLQFIHMMKIRKILGHKTLWCKYIATSPRERWTRSRTLFPVTICFNKVCSMLVQLVYRLMTLKTIILYV